MNTQKSIIGTLIAIFIILAWAAHLVYILVYQAVDLSRISFWGHIILQSWLFTGLFITAHDAMHGTVSRNRTINNVIGFLSTLLYAGMWYPMLVKKHRMHHVSPATGQDPDYHVGNQNFFVWWFSFMKQYLTIWQIIIMAVLFNVGLIFFSELQLIVLWIIPAFLSTFQLFYFGTYLPHRLPHTLDMRPHNSRSQHRNHLWAFLSCYFFGYHSEHHASPATPWWQLYKIKNANHCLNEVPK